MSKQYLYQLQGGKMLVFQDGWIGVEDTGYPLPDCRITVAGKLLNGQTEVLNAILGYDIENPAAFIAEVSKFQPMRYEDFKRKIITENIGGGCPKWLEYATVSGESKKYGPNQSHFRHMLHEYMVREDCTLPSEEYLAKEYGDLLRINWAIHINEPNWRFRNNIIMFTGCREVTERHFEFIRDVVDVCMDDTEKAKYKYISGITLKNGNGAVLLLDSYIGDADIAFLYQSVTKADLSSGSIVVSFDGVDVTAYYKTEDGRIPKKMPKMEGIVRRDSL